MRTASKHTEPRTRTSYKDLWTPTAPEPNRSKLTKRQPQTPRQNTRVNAREKTTATAETKLPNRHQDTKDFKDKHQNDCDKRRPRRQGQTGTRQHRTKTIESRDNDSKAPHHDVRNRWFSIGFTQINESQALSQKAKSQPHRDHTHFS